MKIGLYTTKEALEQIGRSYATVRRWIKDKLIEDVKNRDDNDKRLWSKLDIERFIDFKNTQDTLKRLRRKESSGL